MDVVQQVEYIIDISRISEIRVVNICYLLVCVEDNNCDGGYECIDGTCRYLKIMKVTDFVVQKLSSSGPNVKVKTRPRARVCNGLAHHHPPLNFFEL